MASNNAHREAEMKVRGTPGEICLKSQHALALQISAHCVAPSMHSSARLLARSERKAMGSLSSAPGTRAVAFSSRRAAAPQRICQRPATTEARVRASDRLSEQDLVFNFHNSKWQEPS